MMSFAAQCPVCKEPCHPIQVEGLGMCVICFANMTVGIRTKKPTAPPIAADEIIDLHDLLKPDTVRLCDLGIAA